MNRPILLLLFSFIFSSLSSDDAVYRHLKPALNKSTIHTMKNIDFIYMLNLDQRPQKFERTCAELLPYGIYPYRFSAVNGWELTLDTLNEIGIRWEAWMPSDKRLNYYPTDAINVPYEMVYSIAQQVTGEVGKTYFGCHVALGTIGCVLSHLSILQDAYDSGYNTIWVMEDDIQLIQNPHLLSSLIEELDKTVGKTKWDILFTDKDTKNHQGNNVRCTGHGWRPNFEPSKDVIFDQVKRVGRKFRKIGARYGTYSMIVRRSGMKKILDFVKKHHVFIPIDLDIALVPTIAMYTVLDDVVSTLPYAFSDNGSPYYQDPKSEPSFDEKSKNY